MTSEHRHRLTVRPEGGCPWLATSAPRAVVSAVYVAPGRAAAGCILRWRAGLGGPVRTARHARTLGFPRTPSDCRLPPSSRQAGGVSAKSACRLTLWRSAPPGPLPARARPGSSPHVPVRGHARQGVHAKPAFGTRSVHQLTVLRFAREACAPKGCVHPLLPPRPCLGGGCDHRPGVSPGVSASATVSRARGITPAGSPRRAGPPSKGRGQALLAPLQITGSQSALPDMYEPERRGPGRSRTHRAWRAAQARPTGRRALLLAAAQRSQSVPRSEPRRAWRRPEAGLPGAAKTQTRAGHRRSADKGVKETWT